MRIYSKILLVLTGAWLPIALVLIWLNVSADSTNPFFPPLSVIWEQFTTIWFSDQFVINAVPSLRNLALGYAIAVVVGLVLGAYVGSSRALGAYIEPVADFIRSIPPVATVPIFIVIFGLGMQMRIAAISVSALFPILLATIQAVRSTDRVLLDTTRTMRLSSGQILWRVRMPAGMPMIFSGLQLGLQVAFIVTIASEYLGAGFGMGAFTLIAADSFMILDAWTGVILMGLLGYVINLIFDLVQRIMLSWYVGQKKLAE